MLWGDEKKLDGKWVKERWLRRNFMGVEIDIECEIAKIIADEHKGDKTHEKERVFFQVRGELEENLKKAKITLSSLRLYPEIDDELQTTKELGEKMYNTTLNLKIDDNIRELARIKVFWNTTVSLRRKLVLTYGSMPPYLEKFINKKQEELELAIEEMRVYLESLRNK